MVTQLETIRQSDKSLMVNWQRPRFINAPFICYYQIEVWKTAVPHSSYYIKTFTDRAPFTIKSQALVDDPLTIRIYAVNTNIALNGSDCYCSNNFTKTMKSQETVFYYSPSDNNSQAVRYEFKLVICSFIFINYIRLF